jgi:hypothetical protein
VRRDSGRVGWAISAPIGDSAGPGISVASGKVLQWKRSLRSNHARRPGARTPSQSLRRLPVVRLREPPGSRFGNRRYLVHSVVTASALRVRDLESVHKRAPPQSQASIPVPYSSLGQAIVSPVKLPVAGRPANELPTHRTRRGCETCPRVSRYDEVVFKSSCQ